MTLFPMRPPHALRLKYNRRLELAGAFAEEALTEKDIETVRADLHRNYLESAGTGNGFREQQRRRDIMDWLV